MVDMDGIHLKHVLSEMIQDGCTRPEMARELGVSLARVKRWLSQLGLRSPSGPRKDLVLRARLLDLVSSGVTTIPHLARVLGKPRQNIQVWLKELEATGCVVRDGRVLRGGFRAARVAAEWRSKNQE